MDSVEREAEEAADASSKRRLIQMKAATSQERPIAKAARRNQKFCQKGGCLGERTANFVLRAEAGEEEEEEAKE